MATIVDARGNPVGTDMQATMERALRDAYFNLNRAVYGDGGPLIVGPDWKPNGRFDFYLTPAREVGGLSAWLPDDLQPPQLGVVTKIDRERGEITISDDGDTQP